MTYAPVAGWAQQTTGVIVLMLVSVDMLLYRLRVFVPMPREAHGT
jgi:lipopolysaccharide export system permease protein